MKQQRQAHRPWHIDWMLLLIKGSHCVLFVLGVSDQSFFQSSAAIASMLL